MHMNPFNLIIAYNLCNTLCLVDKMALQGKWQQVMKT